MSDKIFPIGIQNFKKLRREVYFYVDKTSLIYKVLKTERYIYVMEFKLDGTAEEAMREIEEGGYAEPFASDSCILFKIGVNFSSKTRNLEKWLEGR